MDDLGRPKLRMRKHDINFGWFNQVAKRHGSASQERIQARMILDEAGQFYWPDLVQKQEEANGQIEISAGGQSVKVSNSRFSKLAKDVSKELTKNKSTQTN
jgi:hypothetical protein